MSGAPSVVELRQYTLHPGRRDVLIDLFEQAFIESQEDAGIRLIGQFRDLDDPDRFVWLRGFPDMDARLASLTAFYTGPVWRAHRDAANATMIDSDDVLLLKPLEAGGGFPLGDRGPSGVGGPGPGAVVAGVHRVSGPDDDLSRHFQADLAERLAACGLPTVAAFLTEPGPNTFPRLPVREGEVVLVWFAILPNQTAADAGLAAARRDPALSRLFDAPLQMMRLQPTARSRVHG
ncbi:MAG: NIPSNAP family protein [Brevundimonas sp.]|nr:MAG: NIPSNAP family protein [Brevundimonas sp.]